MIAPAAGLIAAAALVAPAAPSTAVVDRTVSCEAGLSGSLPKFVLWSSSALRTGPQKHEASADVRTQVVPGKLTSAQLAIRTTSGKPLAYASFGGARGQAQVYTARRCNG